MKSSKDNVMPFALHFPINVRTMPVKGTHLTLETTKEEREKLAENHGLVSVEAFAASYHLVRWKKRGIKLKGHFKADIVQSCIVSLSPIHNHLEQDIDTIFVPDDSKLIKAFQHDKTGELFLDPDGADMPDVFQGDSIDIGTITEELFELAIDPYPRQANIDTVQVTYDKQQEEKEEQGDAKPVSPFAMLNDLKKK